MKKVFCLLLCALMLFCSACNEEKEPNENLATGIREDSFYTADGNTHNVYITLTMTTTELVAPVTTLSAELKNDSDYVIIREGDSYEFSWEKWENGKWKRFNSTSHPGEDKEEIWMCSRISPHSSYTRTNDFIKSPLEAGIYRLRIEYDMTSDKEIRHTGGDYHYTHLGCTAEVYFTILPAPEA